MKLARIFSPFTTLSRFLVPPCVAPPTTAAPRGILCRLGSDGLALRAFDWESDSAAVCEFQHDTDALNFPGYQFTSHFDQAFRHDLRRAMLDNLHHLFVLEDGSGVCGFLWIVICENNWTGERYGYLNNIYVAPPRRGRGLGKALMAHADEVLRAQGVQKARLTVTSSNQSAVALYEAAGFSKTRWEMEKEL